MILFLASERMDIIACKFFFFCIKHSYIETSWHETSFLSTKCPAFSQSPRSKSCVVVLHAPYRRFLLMVHTWFISPKLLVRLYFPPHQLYIRATEKSLWYCLNSTVQLWLPWTRSAHAISSLVAPLMCFRTNYRRILRLDSASLQHHPNVSITVFLDFASISFSSRTQVRVRAMNVFAEPAVVNVGRARKYISVRKGWRVFLACAQHGLVEGYKLRICTN